MREFVRSKYSGVVVHAWSAYSCALHRPGRGRLAVERRRAPDTHQQHAADTAQTRPYRMLLVYMYTHTQDPRDCPASKAVSLSIYAQHRHCQRVQCEGHAAGARASSRAGSRSRAPARAPRADPGAGAPCMLNSSSIGTPTVPHNFGFGSRWFSGRFLSRQARFAPIAFNVAYIRKFTEYSQY
eukprot:COSAG02_NODE_10004_length_2053_cov_1.771238_3_plen_182_part_01